MVLSRTILVIGAMMAVTPAFAWERGMPPFFAPQAAEDEAPEGYLPRLSAQTGTLCVKQCPADNNPCDPPVLKHADGRCTTQWR